MTAKRILMIAPTPYFSDRGCHVRIYEEAQALQERGHHVLIVTYHLGRDMGDVPILRIPNIPWYQKLAAGPSWHKLYLDILLLYKALAAAVRFKPDILHAHLHEGAFLALLARRSFKSPILFDCQGSLVGELLDHKFMPRKGLRHRLFAKLEVWITNRADFIVTSSTAVAEQIKWDYPQIGRCLARLPDGVDTEQFRPLPKDEALLQELQIPREKKLIVFLGAMTEYQGMDLLLDALSALARERDDFHGLLMGYPHEEYAANAKVLNLGDRVTFTGRIDYSFAPRYLSLGDLAVSPKLSVTEANGKLLNYMACGLPCVVFDNPVNREILGACGVYVETVQAAAFANRVNDLLDDVDYRRELSARSREHAIEKHAWPARINDLEQIYEELVSQR